MLVKDTKLVNLSARMRGYEGRMLACNATRALLNAESDGFGEQTRDTGKSEKSQLPGRML